MKAIKEIIDKVLQILIDVPLSRENDMYLAALFWHRHQGFAFHEFIISSRAKPTWFIDVECFKDRLISFETISRARRKIQEEAIKSGNLGKMKKCLPYDEKVLKSRHLRSEIWRMHVHEVKTNPEAWQQHHREITEGSSKDEDTTISAA